MTIIIGVATPEGLVLAGDSRTTFTDGDHHRIASDNAQKLFEVEGIGIATFGWAFLNSDTIAGVMDQFAAHIPETGWTGVDNFAHQLGGFFTDAFNEHLAAAGEEWNVEEQGYPLGFLVAGYGEDGVGAIYQVLIPFAVEVELAATTTGGGMLWRGLTDVVDRLIKGVDWPCLTAVEVELDEDQQSKMEQLEYNPLLPIALQDGVDYASFMVRTTIDMQRFSDGTRAFPGSIPGCGGPLQVLAVERSRLVWVRPLILHGPSQAGLAEGAAP